MTTQIHSLVLAIIVNAIMIVNAQTACDPPTNQVLDLVFVVDSSGSIRASQSCDLPAAFVLQLTALGRPLPPGCADDVEDNYQLMKNFLKDIVSGLEIGPDNVRVGLTLYSVAVENPFYLNSYETKDDVITAIENIAYLDKSTSTQLALESAQNEQLSFIRGNRPNVPDLVILLTDGQSNRMEIIDRTVKFFDDTVAVLNTAEGIHEAGINIIALGVTDSVNEEEIAGVSSPPHEENSNWFYIEEFSELDGMVQTIVSETCEIVTATTPAPSTTVVIEPTEELIVDSTTVQVSTTVIPDDVIIVDSTTVQASTTVIPDDYFFERSTTVQASTTVIPDEVISTTVAPSDPPTEAPIPTECSHDCSCRLMGDPEILTYDRQVILLSGTNKYTLAQDTSESDQCAYNVEVDVDLISESRPGRDGTSYSFATTEPRSVEISMLGLLITLGQDHSVLVGSDSISLAELPYTGESGGVAYTIKHQQDDADDDFIIFQVDECQFTSGFEGRDVDSVIVLKRCILEDETRSTGLCGSCDADPAVKNDLKTKAGVDVSGQDDMFQLISESYAVAGSEE